jgi:AraC-like DNA-binding protein
MSLGGGWFLIPHWYTGAVVTVSARSANNLPLAAKEGFVDMRGGTRVRAGTWPYDGPDLVTGWHSHDLHQIEYAFTGVVEVEAATAHHLLPPQQAAWIPAGLTHRTTLKGVRSMSVFFEPDMVPAVDGRARILAAEPVIREMILYGGRWPIDRPSSDPTADAFFEALARIAYEWLDRETPLSLPTSTDPDVAAVMTYTHAHLEGVGVSDVAGAVGWSERTLRRRFLEATGMTWRSYLLESRLMRAMALLAEPGPSVLDVAIVVGFESGSAFSRAFGRYCGETPSAYRNRVTPPPPELERAHRATADEESVSA